MNSPTKAEELEGLVLSVQDYKEKDGIVKLATPQGLVSVYARGIQSAASKNKQICQPFSKVRYIYDPKYSRDMLYLVRGSVIRYDYKINDDLLAQSICFVLRDILCQNQMTPVLYQWLEKCWNALNQQDFKAGLLYACLVLREVIVQAGFAPFVDGCVACQSPKGIETISVHDGGFLCRSCNKKQYPAYPKEYLLAFRGLFKARADQVPYLYERYEYTLEQFLDLAKWYEHGTMQSLSSIRFLSSVAHMK